MPKAIRRQFGKDGIGVTKPCRFIAVCTEGLSKAEVKNTISHQLALSYIFSSLGIDVVDLPDWFLEGTALYAPKGQFYCPELQLLFDLQNSHYARSYREYRSVFRYMKEQLGWYGMGAFIRQSIEQHSVDEPMRIAFGVTSYDDLRRQASRWEWENRAFDLLLLLLGSAGLFMVVYMRRSSRRMMVLDPIFEAEVAADKAAQEVLAELEQYYGRTGVRKADERDEVLEQHLEKLALSLVEVGRALAKGGMLREAEQRLDAALHLTPWSSKVATEVQIARGDPSDRMR